MRRCKKTKFLLVDLIVSMVLFSITASASIEAIYKDLYAQQNLIEDIVLETFTRKLLIEELVATRIGGDQTLFSLGTANRTLYVPFGDDTGKCSVAIRFRHEVDQEILLPDGLWAQISFYLLTANWHKDTWRPLKKKEFSSTASMLWNYR